MVLVVNVVWWLFHITQRTPDLLPYTNTYREEVAENPCWEVMVVGFLASLPFLRKESTIICCELSLLISLLFFSDWCICVCACVCNCAYMKIRISNGVDIASLPARWTKWRLSFPLRHILWDSRKPMLDFQLCNSPYLILEQSLIFTESQFPHVWHKNCNLCLFLRVAANNNTSSL